MNVKPLVVRDFEQQYYSASDKDRLKIYSDFRNTYLCCFDHFILQNPFIDIRHHSWFDVLGYPELVNSNFEDVRSQNLAQCFSS